MEDGTEEPYRTVTEKIAEIGNETVEVTYKKLPNGEIRISDAWVTREEK